MSKKLLLADDSVVIQKLVGLSFANENIEIIATDNGDDAVDRVREIVPDVVLADVVMPGKSGYEVCEAIRQDPALAHIPVLLLTGTFEAFDEDRAQSAGANGQITKPFEAQALVARVNEVIESAGRLATDAAESIEAQGDESDFFEARPGSLSSDSQAYTVGSGNLADSDGNDRADGFESGLAAALDLPLDATDPLTDAGELVGSDVSVDASPLAPAERPQAFDPAVPPSNFSRRADDRGSDLDQPSTDSLYELGSPSPLTPPELPTPVEPLAPSAYGTSATQTPLTPPQVPASEAALTPPPLPEIPQADAQPPVESVYASASDVDSALSAASDEAATILVAENDANAKTSPGFAAMETAVSGDDFTMYTPSADIDRDSMTVIAPTTPFATSEVRGPDVADLDARLEGTGLDVSETSQTSEPNPVAPLASSNAQDDSDLLDIGPANLAGDDLDFAFDVSEQQPVDLIGDPFGRSHSPLADISESQILSDPSAELPAEDVSHSEYDVSSSDLSVEDFSQSVLPPSHDSAMTSAAASSDGDSAPAVSPTFGIPMDAPTEDQDPAGTSRGFAAIESDGWGEESRSHEAGADDSANEASVPDLSPMMEQRIQETLEKVAWEAFSDLSESIVKQVMDRVEKIAWEVVPQMAETLVREEIRQMKGDDDDD